MTIEQFIAEEQKGIADYEAMLKQFEPGSREHEVIASIIADEQRHVEQLKTLQANVATNNSRAQAGAWRYGL